MTPAAGPWPRAGALQRRLAGGLCAAALCGLSACSHLPPVAPPPIGTDPAGQPATPQTTPAAPAVVSGRLQLREAAGPDGQPRSQSVGFELQGDDQAGQLRLLGPLGTQVAQAEWGLAGVSLDDGRTRREFADLDELALAMLGEPLPLRALWHWLGGRPWPGAAHAEQDGGFEQLGWQIDLRRWQGEALLQARRLAPPDLQLRVRLDRQP